MSEKKPSGCIVAAVVGIVVVVAVAAVVAILAYQGIRVGKQAVAEQMEKHRAESARIAAEEAETQPVELQGEALPDYSGYQSGDPLTREMFAAWRVDPEATTLVRDTFREKAEGADVTWTLRAGNLRQEGDRITGDFYLPYVLRSKNGRLSETGVEAVRCEFDPAERESLLDIRRDRMATIRGRLSLKTGETLLLDARQAGTEVEKE